MALKIDENDLNIVSGGVKTGNFNNDGKVYITFPSAISFLSNYYSTSELEALAIQYAPLNAIIKMYISKDVVNAVKELYKRENKEMPLNVKELLGIK